MSLTMLFHFLLIATALFAAPLKYNLSVCAVFKNESKYLKEWIEYHRMIGVDHFYLYNVESNDPYINVLKKYIKDDIVTLVQWHNLARHKQNNIAFWMLGTKLPAYENAAKFQSVNKTKWMVFLEIDEFLVPPTPETLPEVLAKYDSYPAIILQSEYFDATRTTEKKLVIQSLDLANPPTEPIGKKVEKTIFRPEAIERFIWPPFRYVFKNEQQAIVLHKYELRINHYANRGVGYYAQKPNQRLNVDNRFLSEDETKRLLNEGYQIEDQERLIHQYVPKMFEKMGYGSSW